ncbi:MAG: prenyltransferase/squalene oxidase repeat-containing protein [Planctomycetota bacterium]
MYSRTHRGLRSSLSVSSSLILLAACATAASATAQGDAPKEAAAKTKTTPTPQQKTPFKEQVDGLIAALHKTMVKTGDDKGAMGDGSCRMTAQILTAMALSHRGYNSSDGPVVRLPVNYLFKCRRSDGAFGNGDGKGDSAADIVRTTQWVLDALRGLDARQHKVDIAEGTGWLKRQKQATSAFARFPGATGPDQLKAVAMAASRGLIRGKDGKPDLRASVDALLTLVKVQVQQRPVVAPKGPAFAVVQRKAVDYLLTQQENGVFFVKVKIGQGPNAKFMKVPNTGLTGIGLAALMTKPEELRTETEQKIIDSGLQYLLKQQQREPGPTMGSFGGPEINYTTCAAIMALSKARRPGFKEALNLAQRYILAIQNAEHRDYGRQDRDFGSIGYGGDLRGDLSNTQFALEGLKNTGIPANDEAFVKAIVFLQRTQNLKKVNDFKGKARKSDGTVQDVVPDNDGGAAYYPGNSPAGYKEQADGSRMPRSYGSMTYALLKAYTLCGLPKDDPRIQAAVKWIARNWTLDQNPGSDPAMPDKTRYQGLYYYYMVMAQALDTAGIDRLVVPGETDAETQVIPWRPLLQQKLRELQKADGSWINDKNDRWWEGQKLVCTVYALLALERCQ